MKTQAIASHVKEIDHRLRKISEILAATEPDDEKLATYVVKRLRMFARATDTFLTQGKSGGNSYKARLLRQNQFMHDLANEVERWSTTGDMPWLQEHIEKRDAEEAEKESQP